MEAEEQGKEPPSRSETPFPAMVGKAAAHCGAGCTVGDVCSELLVFAFPAIATWFGWKSIFPDSPAGKLYAVWALDFFLLAFLVGVAIQYLTIVPMRDLKPFEGILAAIKADALSLTSWQIGMCGFMAIAQFLISLSLWDRHLEANMPEFWFMMQIAMLAGFATSYPVNWRLIRKGIKGKM